MTFTEHKLLSMDIHSSEAFKQGGRRGAKKVMIVITDGESHDNADLQQVIEDSEKDGITRYAIAVSIAFLQLTSLSFLLFLLWYWSDAHFHAEIMWRPILNLVIEVTFSCWHQWKGPNAFTPTYWALDLRCCLGYSGEIHHVWAFFRLTDSCRSSSQQVLGYYNRRGINPEAFLNEIKYIASDPDDKHFFNVTDEAALKDIVDALGERIFSLEGWWFYHDGTTHSIASYP